MPNQCAAANPAIASLLQSTRPAGRVAELGSLDHDPQHDTQESTESVPRLPAFVAAMDCEALSMVHQTCSRTTC